MASRPFTPKTWKQTKPFIFNRYCNIKSIKSIKLRAKVLLMKTKGFKYRYPKVVSFIKYSNL